MRFEPTHVGECYEHLGRCALSESGLSKVAVSAMRAVDLTPSMMRQDPGAGLVKMLTAARKAPKNVALQQAYVEQCVDLGKRFHETDPERALGFYLAAAEHAGQRIEASHFFSHASQYATARVVELLGGRGIVRGIPSVNGAVNLRVTARESEGRVNPGRFDSMVASDRVEVNVLSQRVRQEGIGAPFVAGVEPPESPDVKPYFPLGGLYQPLSAVLSFRGRDATLTFYDSLRKDSVRVNGRDLPLAADYSAAWARFVDQDPNKKAFLGMLRPDATKDYMRLTLTEPFRRDAIPVIFVHGLASNGATWDETINGLLADPEIRRRYQFWIYQYPSGYPFIYPAADLRRTIREVRKYYDPSDRLPVLDKMVLVGHSMGGLISSAQIRRTDDAVMGQFFKRPLNQLDAPEETKQRLRDLLYLNPEGYIRRVIFVATPHRGSTIADGWVGRLTSRLIKLPSDIVSFNLTGIMQELTDTGLSLVDLAPNSVTRLQYYNPLLRTLIELPIDERVTIHTIAGDRGLGNAPNSSDGVVSYQSSHLESAVSEKVVGARHSAHRHPDAIEEIRRILLLHLGQQ